MAEHGTRTMYVHYGCRCEACCRAEHQQYLKRKEAQNRKRVNSKWSDPDGAIPYSSKENRRKTQRKYNLKRYHMMKGRPSTHTRRITWAEIADVFEMKCAICGITVDPNDTWINDTGRKCFGRRYPTVDHIVPLKAGGADLIENVQLTCKHCNSAKGVKRNVAII